MARNRREKGTGTIFKRNGKYVYQFRDVLGKLKTQSLRDESGNAVTVKTQAEKIVAGLQEERQKLESVASKMEYLTQVAELKSLVEVCRLPIGELESSFFESTVRKEVSDSQNASYRTAIRHFALWIHTNLPDCLLLSDISEAIAIQYMTAYWQSGISAVAYNCRLKCLRVILRLFLKDNNPFGAILKKSEECQARQAFSLSQLQAIWTLLESEDYYMLHKHEMRILYFLALYTGARCGDLCTLEWSSIDLLQRTICLTPAKTRRTSKKSIILPIALPLYNALLDAQEWQTPDSPYALPRVAERYLRNPDGIYQDTIKLLEQAGIITKEEKDGCRRQRRIVRYSMHSFRHTAASLMINSGANQAVVKELLGHSSIEMTSRYTHIAQTASIEAINTLPAISASMNQAEQRTGWKAILDVFQTANPNQTLQLAKYLDMVLSDEQKQDIMMIA